MISIQQIKQDETTRLPLTLEVKHVLSTREVSFAFATYVNTKLAGENVHAALVEFLEPRMPRICQTVGLPIDQDFLAYVLELFLDRLWDCLEKEQ